MADETNGNGQVVAVVESDSPVTTLEKSPEKVYQPWQFKPGKPGGPGRPKGSVSFETKLRNALAQVEKRRKVPFLVHAIERAYENDKVLPAVLDRVVPRLAPPAPAYNAPITVGITLINAPLPAGEISSETRHIPLKIEL